MAEENKTPKDLEGQKTGSVNISNDVVSIVASLAASSVKGVSGMVSSMSGGIAELLGKKNMSKGVKVSVNGKDVTLNLAIIVEYGAKIPDVAWEIQEKVKSEVEAMTGLNVVSVNVSVEGVNVPKSDTGKIPSQPVKIKSASAETPTPDKENGENAEEISGNAEEDTREAPEKASEEIQDTLKDTEDEIYIETEVSITADDADGASTAE